jgi:nifR3 family TIM-barrel protein
MLFCDIPVSGRAFLAPLAGVTNAVFRRICRSRGAALVYNEMTSVDGLVRGHAKTLRYLKFFDDERPLGIQLFGSEPAVMAEAAQVAAAARPDLIDLNFGCPVRKVVKRGSGSAMMKDLKKMAAVVSAVCAATDLPVTAKIRSGWDHDSINAVEAAQAIEQAGGRAVTVHARTQNMFFTGRADWSVIAAVKQAVKIPVVGNGDITSAVTARRMLDETGCDFLMVGRAALANPWIFREINEFLETGTIPPPISAAERFDLCRDHIRQMVELKGERVGLRESRKFCAWYTKGLSWSARFRESLFKLDKLADIEKLLEDFETNFITDQTQVPA